MGVLQRLFGGGQAGPVEGEIRQLTDQFYVTLEAYFSKIKSMTPPPPNADAFKAVGELLSAPRNWTNAYAIEQLLVLVMGDETIAHELPVRVREARTALREPLADYYATEAAKTDLTPADRRVLLGRLVNDLQWRYTVNEVSRQYSRGMTVSVAWFFMISMVTFALIILSPYVWPFLKNDQLLLLVPAMFAGAWGAAFSLLSNLQSRLKASELDDLKVIRAKSVILSRLLIGAGAASILYFFFVSGLLTSLISGAAVPDLTTSSLQTDALKNLALLVVWCFVAGFSERMIPDLISRAEAGMEGKGTSERFRPDADTSGAGSRATATTTGGTPPKAAPASTGASTTAVAPASAGSSS